MPEADEASHLQVERILQSETLRASDAIRRLLRYLADQTFSGGADQLKEYTVAVACLGKPETYDPREESAVRIQVGRLRQKLVEYYHTEGKDDPVVVGLPKGRFTLTFETRTAEVPAAAAHPSDSEARPEDRASHRPLALAGTLLLAVFCCVYLAAELWKLKRNTALFSASWTPEIRALWEPFVATDRPLLVAVGEVPLASIEGFGYFGPQGVATWDDLLKSPVAKDLQKHYPNARWQPYFFLTGVAEATACFDLGKLLGPRVRVMRVTRGSDVIWPQLADDNVVYVGPAAAFQERLHSLPIEAQFLQNQGGIDVLHPRQGDPPIPTLGYGPVRGTGEQYALVSSVPGPDGIGIIRAFTSIGTTARATAVQFFTDAAAVHKVFGTMAERSGSLPRYFQLVLKVRYVQGVATNTEYVAYRELPVKPARR